MKRRPVHSLHSLAYKRFRLRLCQARTESRLTQREVASRLGKPPSYVAKVELGERRLDAVELAAFIRIYRKPFAFFVG
jgi:transcriptional regulator with XRE-family HTH domain